MTDRINEAIQSNVRRTDELLSQLSMYKTSSSRFSNPKPLNINDLNDDLSHRRSGLANFDVLRASINSLELKSPKSTVNIFSPKSIKSTQSPLMQKMGLARNDNNNDNHRPNPMIGTYRSSLSPLKQTYGISLNLPIDTLLFDKLNESMDDQENKLIEWNKVIEKSNDPEDIAKNDIEESQLIGNELIDLQISTLEELSHDIAPSAFNDNKTIHKISRLLNERNLSLDSDKINFESKLTSATSKRERLEKELEEITKKLHAARNDESELNNKLHEITIELNSINDQISITNSMKNKINTNLHKMNDIEKKLIDGINDLKDKMKSEWNSFKSNWKQWSLSEIATWINHHGLQLKYSKKELIENMSNKLEIESGQDLLGLNKNDWITMGITNARDRQYLRNEFGILTAPPSIRDDFKCPLTKQLMQDPVIAADGYTYDRRAIQDWFMGNKKKWNNVQCVISPITGDILTTDMLFSNHQLFKQIQDYRKANNIQS